MPDRCCSRFSAVRSAVSSPTAGPSSSAITAPASTLPPSSTWKVTLASGTTRRNTSATRGNPATTIGSRAAMTPWKWRSAGITAVLVTSPGPISSASAASTMRSMAAWSSGASKGMRIHGLGHVEHALQRLQRGLAQFFRHLDRRSHVAQAQIQLLQGVLGHERAAGAIARAVGAGRADEGLVRRVLAHLMDDAGLGRDDEFLAFVRRHIFEDRAGRADMVGVTQHGFRAFRMGGDLSVGMTGLQLDQLAFGKLLVDDAAALPQRHVAAGLAGQIGTEMAVGGEDDLLVGRQLGQDRLGVGRGDDDVRLRLHIGRAIDVGDGDMIRARLAELAEFLGRAAVFERAAGGHVGQQHGLVRADDLGDLAHEADAAEHDDVGIGGRRLARQIQRIADEVSEILDLSVLIIVRENNRVAFFLETLNLSGQIKKRIDFGLDRGQGKSPNVGLFNARKAGAMQAAAFSIDMVWDRLPSTAVLSAQARAPRMSDVRKCR